MPRQSPDDDELPLAKRVRGNVVLDEGDLEALASLSRHRQTVSRGTVLSDRTLPGPCAFVVHDGWAMRFAMVPGGRRQIVGFVLPGETFGLSGLILGEANETVAAITPTTASRLDWDELEAAMRDHPGLRRALLWCVAQEYALLCDRLVSLGRRSALERMARLLLELAVRQKAVDEMAESLPLTQPILADALGLSAVHVNRTLKRLRGAKLISVGRHLAVEDLEGLAHLAHVEPGDPLYALVEAWLPRVIEIEGA